MIHTISVCFNDFFPRQTSHSLHTPGVSFRMEIQEEAKSQASQYYGYDLNSKTSIYATKSTDQKSESAAEACLWVVYLSTSIC